jgi:hypothetical protein
MVADLIKRKYVMDTHIFIVACVISLTSGSGFPGTDLHFLQ